MRTLVWGVDQLAEPAADRAHDEIGGIGQPAAHDDDLGVERIGEIGHSESGPPAERVDDGHRHAIALAGRRHHVLAPQTAVVATSERAADLGRRLGLVRPARQTRSRGVTLPAAAPTADALGAARLHDHVTDLAGEAVAPAHQLSLGDDATTDTGPEGDEQRICGAPGGTHPPFGHGRTRRVVVDDDRSVEPLREALTDPQLADRSEVR